MAELHNVSIRCSHGFVAGFCVCPGCPHREKHGRREYDASTAKRVRVHECCEAGCTSRGVVSRREQRSKQRRIYWYCAGHAARLGIQREEAA